MRLRSILFPMMVIFALLLAACGPQNNQNGDAVGTVFPEGETAAPGEIPETGSDLEATEMPLEATPTLEGEAETPEMDATPTVEAAEPTMEATQAATPADQQATPTRAAAGQPGDGMGTGIIGIPETGSGDLAGLSEMFGFRVEDTNGNAIGTVRDYVINMCEANILYIVVDREGEAGGMDSDPILIPYQVTLETPNNGRVDAGQRLFVIDRDAEALADAPSVDLDNLDLQAPQVWDEDQLAYWRADFDLALTSACNVPVGGLDNGAAGTDTTGMATAETPGVDSTPQAGATPQDGTPEAGTAQPGMNQTPTAIDTTGTRDRQDIYRLALASRVLEAELQDGNGQRLGSLEEIAIVPATGRTQYLLIQPEDGEGAQADLVALPPAAVNVMYEGMSDQPVLVLLLETSIYRDAPTFDRTTGANDQNWFDYWDQYLPMTMEQLP